MSTTDANAGSVPPGFLVPPVLEAVSHARRRVLAIVRGVRPGIAEDALHDVEVLTGEVVANAVTHTRASCTVSVRWTGKRVRVEVTDADRRLPAPSTSGPDEETGRGLQLVEALSAAWGCVAVPAGKVVWFEVGSGSGQHDPHDSHDDHSLHQEVCAHLPARRASHRPRTAPASPS